MTVDTNVVLNRENHYGPLPFCVALGYYACIKHLPSIFYSGVVAVSPVGETSSNSVNCEAWLFLGPFREKIMEVVVVMKVVIQVNFTGGP